MRVLPILALALGALSLPACDHAHGEGGHSHEEHHKIVVTSPLIKDVTVTQQYVGQVRSQNHIEIKALQEGYLEPIQIKEGQAVRAGEVLFKVVPTLYEKRLNVEKAEVRFAQLQLDLARGLNTGAQPVVSRNDVALREIELAKAEAKAAQAQAELDFTVVRAPWDGIVDRLGQQQGSLVKKEEVLTTLSDNRVMWVKFNVPEARYFEYMVGQPKGLANNSRIELADSRIELVLADGNTFEYDAGNTVTVEGEFNRETGNIQFRADFPNPNGLLRFGQTGTVLVRRKLHHVVVIPQRATFEFLDKRYVYVVGADNVVHQRLITVSHEQDDIFVVSKGLDPHDKIIYEGIKQVSENQKLEEKPEFKKPEEILADQKLPAQ